MLSLRRYRRSSISGLGPYAGFRQPSDLLPVLKILGEIFGLAYIGDRERLSEV